VPAAAAGLTALLYGPVFAGLAPRWFKEEAYYHCPFVVAIVAWLVWRRRAALREVEARPGGWGLVILAAGLLVYAAGARTGVHMLSGSSLPMVLMGLAWTLWGRRVFGLVAIPLALSFFLVPVPRHVLGHVAFPMQIASAQAAAVLGKVTGLDVVAHGVNMDSGGFRFVVAQECSGLNSLMALLLASGVLAELMVPSLIGRLVILAAAPFIVLCSNVLRLLTVLWVSQFLGAQTALDSLVHGTSDVIVYSFSVLLAVLLAGYLARLPAGGPGPAGSACGASPGGAGSRPSPGGPSPQEPVVGG
jgi:exosortase